ncbi:MAG TPA: COX15/CtaA family protein [Alphaproteobacteria bacterium]|nr:COX15/CtaA family protein [Alphaproteobacteria bacterium]
MTPQPDTLFKGSLISLTLMILGMVVIGGLTRLTGSGLSIVEWKPIVGIFPPLTNHSWLIEFSKYQQSPEFQKINFGMTLSEFQSIFWLEYIHRLWGRLLGLVLLIPTFLIIFKNQHRELWFPLVLLWVLGAAQGMMGWLMVKSGLLHDPHVSPYRLAAHLLLGFAVFGVALWMTLSLYKTRLMLQRIGYSQQAFQSLKKLAFFAIFLVLLTALLGAFVAGLKAGLIYNTFPLMGGCLIPYEFLSQSPWWKDCLENPVSVQFLHRFCAIMTTTLCFGIWIYQRKLAIPPLLSYAFAGVAIAAFLQLSFGIATLLLVVPVGLATLHQGFAFILFGCLLYALFLILTREGS